MGLDHKAWSVQTQTGKIVVKESEDLAERFAQYQAIYSSEPLEIHKDCENRKIVLSVQKP